jgi:hypothetical protein
MAKKRKYPKRPKVSSSLQVWKNYEARCKDVDRYNSQLERDKKAKANLVKKISNRR